MAHKGMNEFKIGLISDLDRRSKIVNGDKVAWKGLLRKGTLVYNEVTKHIDIELLSDDHTISLMSEYSIGGRGMELSELVKFNGRFYTVDDRTGIIFDITDEKKSIPWAILSTGDGRQDKGFKGEWMTVKDDKLYVGGHGKEFLSRDGTKIVNRFFQWVKVITKDGGVTHVNWEKEFDAIRTAAGCPYPGYMTHESGVWSDVHKQWFFLPRKASKDAYDYKKDETRAANLLIRCSEDFKDIKVVTIGELKEKSRGFSTFKFVPGTDDKIIVAIKTEEFGDEQRSFLFAFTIDGEVLLDDKEFSKTNKFEGIAFM